MKVAGSNLSSGDSLLRLPKRGDQLAIRRVDLGWKPKMSGSQPEGRRFKSFPCNDFRPMFQS